MSFAPTNPPEIAMYLVNRLLTSTTTRREDFQMGEYKASAYWVGESIRVDIHPIHTISKTIPVKRTGLASEASVQLPVAAEGKNPAGPKYF